MAHDKLGPRKLALRVMREKRAERAAVMVREAKKTADKYIDDPKRSRITEEVIGVGVRPSRKKAKRK